MYDWLTHRRLWRRCNSTNSGQLVDSVTGSLMERNKDIEISGFDHKGR